jgi:hypothetical protein
LFNAIQVVNPNIRPRWSMAEIISEVAIRHYCETHCIRHDTAVLLNTGACHSIAMAKALAEYCGHQPILLIQPALTDEHAIKDTEEILATILFYAPFLGEIRCRSPRSKAHSPPAFILDCHRSAFENEVLHRPGYRLAPGDFPTGRALIDLGITNAICLEEIEQTEEIRTGLSALDITHRNNDLIELLRDWERAGLRLSFAGVQPWRNPTAKEAAIFRDHL